MKKSGLCGQGGAIQCKVVLPLAQVSGSDIGTRRGRIQRIWREIKIMNQSLLEQAVLLPEIPDHVQLMPVNPTCKRQ